MKPDYLEMSNAMKPLEDMIPRRPVGGIVKRPLLGRSHKSLSRHTLMHTLLARTLYHYQPMLALSSTRFSNEI